MSLGKESENLSDLQENTLFIMKVTMHSPKKGK